MMPARRSRSMRSGRPSDRATSSRASRWPRLPARASRFAVGVLILYFALEYARPMGLQQLHLQFLIIAGLPLGWLVWSDRRPAPVIAVEWIFLGWCLLTLPFAANHFAAYLTSRIMFGNLAVALGISWILSDPRALPVAIWSWVAVMVYVAVFALVQGGVGPGGFIGDENDVALGLCTAVPFAFFGVERFSGWRRLVCAGVLAVLVSATVATFSRGGFVGLVVLSVYCVVVSRRRLRNIALLLVAAGIFAVFAPQEYRAEVKTLTDADEGTVIHRQFMWTIAYRMWIENPISGVGAGNFPYVAGRYQPTSGDWPWHYFERDWSGTAVHSMYFELLAEHGPVGLVLVGMVVVLHFRTIRRARTKARSSRNVSPLAARNAEMYGQALAAGMGGFLAAGAFLSVAYYPYLWYFPAFATAVEVAVDRTRNTRRRRNGGERKASGPEGPALCETDHDSGRALDRLGRSAGPHGRNHPYRGP